jgi:hypothetical protein
MVGGRLVVPIRAGMVSELRLGFSEGGGGPEGHGGYELRYAVSVTGHGVTILTPGQTWHRYVFPGGGTAEVHEDTTGVLSGTVTPAGVPNGTVTPAGVPS